MCRDKTFFAIFMATLCLFLSHSFNAIPAAAQMDWLKAGKDLLGAVGTTPPDSTSDLTNSEITNGLKDALRVGTETVVSQLGQLDGFNADPAIHIPLPDSLNQVKSALSAIGMSSMMDDLELKLNRAAEEATPPAKKLFWDAITAMTLDDVKGIYNGPDDSATRYFQNKMSAPLSLEMQPIVENALNQVGAVQAYDAVMGQYSTIPFVPDVKADLNKYVVDKGMEGIFHYVAIEEAAIRNDPVKRTTDILQKVFGAK
jgi:hypothetical protein